MVSVYFQGKSGRRWICPEFDKVGKMRELAGNLAMFPFITGTLLYVCNVPTVLVQIGSRESRLQLVITK